MLFSVYKIIICVSVITTCLLINEIFGQIPDGIPCETPNEEFGNCISIKKCKYMLNLLLTKRNDPKTRNYLLSSTCGYDNGTPRVCCPNVDTRNINIDDNKPTTTEKQINDKHNNNNIIIRPPDCGGSNTTTGRVVGGVPAKLGDYPWVVELGYKNSKNPDMPKWLCGGSLISNKHVITAAHCVYNRDDLYLVRVGDLDLYSNDDGADPENIPISKKIVHEDYNTVQYVNDIAILTLQRVPKSRTAYPICLPIDEPQRSNNLNRHQILVAGWGSVYFRGPSSPTLQVVRLPVQENSLCKRAFGNRSIIDNRIICAGTLAGGKDSCRGDSGGPLMTAALITNDKPTYFLHGVVSYGFKCAEPGYPGVYTRVTAFIEWIKRNLN